MAVAALEILGLTHLVAEVLSVELMVPMVGQGTVAVECRSDDHRVRNLLDAVDDASTRAAVEVERSFLAELGAGCSLPVGALADGDVLHTFLADPSTGRHVVQRDHIGHLDPVQRRVFGADAARRARRAVGG